MKAAVIYGPKNVKIKEVSTPLSPRPDEAIIRVNYASICGTDLHIYRGDIPVKVPIIMGHEYTGRVLQVGLRVKKFKAGDKVIGPYLTTCGVCRFCVVGKPQLCESRSLFGINYDGSFAQYLRIPHADRSLVKLPDQMSMKTGVLIPDMFLTALYAIDRGKVGLGTKVLVVGLGAIGLSCILVSKIAGSSLIIGVDTRDKNLHKAMELGADHIINSDKEPNILDVVRKITGGVGVDVALGLRGAPPVIASTLDLVRPCGKYIQIAISRPGLLDLRYVTSLEKTIIGVLNPASKEYIEKAIDVVTSHQIDLSSLISHEFTLDEITKAFELADNNINNYVKIVIKI